MLGTSLIVFASASGGVLCSTGAVMTVRGLQQTLGTKKKASSKLAFAAVVVAGIALGAACGELMASANITSGARNHVTTLHP